MLCLIDGFNLYHSLRDCEHDTDARVRWLDLRSLCESLLHVLPGECAIGEVVYFSALAHHIEASRPGTIERHQRYMDVLRASGVSTRLGQFKRRRVVCPVCGAARDRYEEKETDVAIASRLLAPETRERYSVVLVVTGDTDLVPAIQTARSGSSALTVAVAFPYRRVNRQLRFAADASLRLGRASYLRHQFPLAAPGSDGSLVSRPTEWNRSHRRGSGRSAPPRRHGGPSRRRSPRRRRRRGAPRRHRRGAAGDVHYGRAPTPCSIGSRSAHRPSRGIAGGSLTGRVQRRYEAAGSTLLAQRPP